MKLCEGHNFALRLALAKRDVPHVEGPTSPLFQAQALIIHNTLKRDPEIVTEAGPEVCPLCYHGWDDWIDKTAEAIAFERRATQ